MYDETVLGEVGSDAELSATLSEYDSLWYIGMEEDYEWLKSIVYETPQLFTIGHDQQTVSKREREGGGTWPNPPIEHLHWACPNTAE